MSDEIELKAVIEAPAAVREALREAGATPVWEGMMEDLRFDREGELEALDEVLRIRTFRSRSESKPVRVNIAWKGATRRTAEGYKARRELEYLVVGPDSPIDFLRALGYTAVQAIDRYVEISSLAGASLRLEWYPRMDVLLEVEGSAESIESAVRASKIPRERFLPDALVEFVSRYERRTRHRAVLALADLGGASPSWASR